LSRREDHDDPEVSAALPTGPLGPLCGARLDRFNTFAVPIESRRDMELMDHINTRLWPGFLAAFKGTSDPFPAFWLPCCTVNPDLFHALLFASSCHLASRLSMIGQSPQLRREQLSHQTKTITAIRKRLQNEITSNEDIDEAKPKIEFSSLRIASATVYRWRVR
jgi:hypothetical protein